MDEKREYSKGLYSVPLLDPEGYVQLIRVRGMRSAAHIETRRTVRGTRGDLSDMERGTTTVTWEWKRADMVIGRDSLHCKPELFCGWPKEDTSLEVMGTMGLYTRKDLGSSTGGTRRPGLLRARRRLIKGVFCTDSANIFYQPLSSLPRHRERWRGRKRH
jgi:hypothetical protein